MTRKEIIDGLKFTVDMFLFDPSTGETYTEPRNEEDKITIDACKGAIELLEQEPCEDAIIRQAALDCLTATGLKKYDYILNARNKIKSLPSVTPQPRWIPCSERLPEDIKPVIVTWKNNDPKSYYQYIVGKHFIGTAHYLNGKWFWYSSATEDLLAEYGRCDGEEFDEAIEVVAWMPLPEPYKAESEEIE